jgi:SAM-dependent methyltransferase
MTTDRRRARPARPARAPFPDRHALYEASVQGVEYDLDFFSRVYRGARGREPLRFREDFCGTAAMASAWVTRGPRHRAWGVDLDDATLEWARTHHLAHLHESVTRVTLLRADVRTARVPPVDIACAFNFSYWIFKQRRDLVAYFRAVRRGLAPGGMLFVNTFGGSEAMGTLVESRRIPASQGADGTRVPPFTYIWEQARFDPATHQILCHIHFRLRDGRMMRRAFTYDWRMWTLPELRDAMLEAGFADAWLYAEGWDDAKNASDDVYRRRVRFEQQESWLAVMVGVR